MTIMGESLMNDGTAIVLFNLFWNFYNDNPSLGNGNLIISYDTPGKIVLYFLRMAIGGPILGIIIGWLGCKWMGLANHKYSHSDVTIQTSITVCVAYLAFFIGESEVVVSGVLCTVSAALVMADRAWPIVINHDSMENVWHALEYFGNTLLFFLAGVISSRAIRGYNDQKSAQVRSGIRGGGTRALSSTHRLPRPIMQPSRSCVSCAGDIQDERFGLGLRLLPHHAPCALYHDHDLLPLPSKARLW